MIENFGMEGKGEEPFIKLLLEQLFAGMDDSEYSVLNVCGIQPYTRRRNEIDLLMILRIERKSRHQIVQYNYPRKDQGKVRDQTGTYSQC